MVKESEDAKRRRELFDQHRLQAWGDMQAMSDQIDKSILTFSTAGLGLSVTFLREQAVGLGLWIQLVLCLSWLAFAFAILATIFSFDASVKAQRLSIDHYYKYYIEYKEEFQNPKNKYDERNSWLMKLAIVNFVGAIVLTIILAVGVLFSGKPILGEGQAQGKAAMEQSISSANDLEKGRSVVPRTPIPPSPSIPVTPTGTQPTPDSSSGPK